MAPLNLSEFAQLVAAVIESLPQDLTPAAVESWRRDRRALAEALRNALCPTVPMPFLQKPQESEATRKFPVWKTIQIGTHQTVASLIEAARKTGVEVSDSMRMVSLVLAPHPQEISLVKVRRKDLSGKSRLGYHKMYDRGMNLGLKPCPDEVALQLCRQYPEQPLGEVLWFATEEEYNNVDMHNPSHWVVGRGDHSVRWCRKRDVSGYGRGDTPGHSWRASHRMVFCL